jgi:phenylalanyl-tRNA synthetase beta chain
MLETAARNQRQNNFNLRLVELSKVFFSKEGEELPEERFNLCGLLSGLRRPPGWNETDQTVDFYDAKGAVEVLLMNLGVRDLRWSDKDSAPYLNPEAAARVYAADANLGDLGEVDPGVLESFDVKGPVYLFDIDFDLLMAKTISMKKFQPLPRFPAINRDLAIVVSDAVPAQDLLDYLEKHRPQYAESITLFDQYRGAQLAGGRKSLAFRIIYRSEERSLTDLEVNEIHTDLSQKIVDAFEAQLRS